MIIVLSLLYLPGGTSGDIDFGLTVHAATTDVTFKAVDGKPSGFSGEGYANLFDNNTSTKWCCNYSSGSTYVVIKASEPINASGYTISTGNDTGSNSGRNPKAWTLSACNDYNEKTKTSENWTVIDKVTDGGLPAANEQSKSFALKETPAMYRYFRLDITQLVSGNILQISDFSFTYTTCGHQWGDYGEKVDPDCLNYGYTPQFCTVCGYAKETDIVDALGHNFENRVCTR